MLNKFMDYQRIYDNLMTRSRERMLEGYTERHHIIPRCLGGSDEQDNIAILTAREHYIAHQLLVKLYPDNYKIAYAAKMMTIDKTGGRSSNRQYEWLQKAFLKTDRSEIYTKALATKRQRGTDKLSPESIEKLKASLAEANAKPDVQERRRKAARGRKLTDEGKAKLSAARKGNVPWNKGIPASEEANKKRSETQKARYANQEHHLKGRPSPHKGKPSSKKGIPTGPKPKIVCEHCQQEIGGHANYTRWHGSNCRLNPSRSGPSS